MFAFLSLTHTDSSRASVPGTTPLARLARASNAAATGFAANGPAVGITAAIAVPIKMEGN